MLMINLLPPLKQNDTPVWTTRDATIIQESRAQSAHHGGRFETATTKQRRAQQQRPARQLQRKQNWNTIDKSPLNISATGRTGASPANTSKRRLAQEHGKRTPHESANACFCALVIPFVVKLKSQSPAYVRGPTHSSPMLVHPSGQGAS
jgi:hypothetical protein